MPKVQEYEEVLASEAARMLECSPQLVRLLFDQGRLTGRRGPSGIRLIDAESVRRLAHERRQRREAGRP